MTCILLASLPRFLRTFEMLNFHVLARVFRSRNITLHDFYLEVKFLTLYSRQISCLGISLRLPSQERAVLGYFGYPHDVLRLDLSISRMIRRHLEIVLFL